MVALQDDLLSESDRGSVTLLVLLDLSAAFDTIDHDIIGLDVGVRDLMSSVVLLLSWVGGGVTAVSAEGIPRALGTPVSTLSQQTHKKWKGGQVLQESGLAVKESWKNSEFRQQSVFERVSFLKASGPRYTISGELAA